MKNGSGFEDLLYFFFQAEDGIRDLTVTGVQTCALPIYRLHMVDSAVTATSNSAAQSKHLIRLRSGVGASVFGAGRSASCTRKCWRQFLQIGRASCRERV